MVRESMILDCVVEILKVSTRQLRAREICRELRKKGVDIEKTKLNQILYNRNDRPEIHRVEGTFEWRYDPGKASEAEKLRQYLQEYETRLPHQLRMAAYAKELELIGFEFTGVKRKGTDKPLFFLGENTGFYTIIGPQGNILKEKAEMCEPPEPMDPKEFTFTQVVKAIIEIVKIHEQKRMDEEQYLIRILQETNELEHEVYLGPEVISVEDSIPVDGIIFVVNVSGQVAPPLVIGARAVWEPAYLVINKLGMGIRTDVRYGVYKVCVYKLLKQGILQEQNGVLILNISMENDCVCLGTERHKLYLE